MTDQEIEENILEKIKAPMTISKSFSELVSGFESKYAKIDFNKSSFPINQYFGSSMGQVSATLKLLADNKIKQDWLEDRYTKNGNIKNDFKGIYFFINDKTPFYVGISKGVIGRILQHTKGHSHNTSTLAYNIGLLRYELISGNKYLGVRKELNFKNEVEPVKKFLLNQKIAFLHIDNDYELYLFEVYCSMKLRTILNNFETH